ncbi:uncharacterized protein Z520_10866 [Fonsecaea multimorphosa CBS 102226]|uniref:Uncharacterized protein n=1 Tax=Fonsecaea multimorphosa CBS 102226 TaxID=1442371 RepID=A0A0D2JJS6_9EURO|nr:uncharacterized protein Z520_10866 [Fonsecaea multimorphosa CBS 102226]KIX93447.1 hypothetical protein Z520_10866 [Fonsecaea multimorphosa CBS 102226]OAL18744.1 hypothetical protein AYO22_10437 [Fonsecaea multimorphosa]
MDRKSSSHQAPASPSPPQKDGYSPPTIDQSHDVALVIKALDHSYKCHGVCSTKILLWGSPGCGKRRIATQAALEFSTRTGCKVLWIDGRSFESFIRDYRAAYTKVTGEHLPQGLTLTHTLLKIRSTLEARRDELLTVVFDMESCLEEDMETELNAPDLYLPDRGRILCTSSYAVLKVAGSDDHGPPEECGLKFASRATCLYVSALSEEQALQYFRASLPNTNDEVSCLRAFWQFRLKAWHTAPLRLALSCACMRLLHFSPSRFQQLCAYKAREGYSPTWPGYSPIFSDIMSILWDALNDYDVAAGELLVVCSAIDPMEIPVALVEKFPMFQNNQGRLLSTIDLLRLSGLLEIHQGPELATINLHPQVQRWLQLKRQEIDDKHESTDLVHTWISVLSDYLAKPEHDLQKGCPIFDPEKFWGMFAHIISLCNLKSGQIRQFCSPQYMTFLKHVAIFLVDDGIFQVLAGLAITHALDMCTLLQTRQGHNTLLDREYVHIRQVMASALIQLSEYVHADRELREAKRFLMQHLLGGASSTQMLREIEDTQAYLSIMQRNWPEASRMLAQLLSAPEPDHDIRDLAKRHHWMSRYKAAVDADFSALEHSHMTMSYWRDLPYEEQWGFKDTRLLSWVEKHMMNLMNMRKYKGALLFGTRLLERAYELSPILGNSVCCLTYRVVYCQCMLDMADDAEKTVCRLLELPSHDNYGDDTTRAYLLYTLNELAILLQRNGRAVEAEGLYRFNIQTSKLYDVKNLSGTETYDSWRDYGQLHMCLIEQGKVLEARKLKEEYELGNPDKEFRDSAMQNNLTALRYSRELYVRALEAEKSGTTLEFKAALDLAETRPAFKRAVKWFGSPKRRVERGRDFESDVDLHHIGRARNSRLLQLLKFPLVYLAFIDGRPRTSADNTDNTEFLWASLRQSVLGQYWQWCDCRRKRQRSQSVHEWDRYTVRPTCDSEGSQLKKLKQKLITGWVIRTPATTKAVAADCSADCPCVEANKRGLLETCALESKLWLWEEPTLKKRPSKIPARFRNTKPNRSPIPENEYFTLVRPNTWFWIQSEFANGEIEGENYIIPRAVEIPGIAITPPEGQTDLLPLATDPQESLTKYYKRDYAADFASVLEKQEAKWYSPTRLDDILEDDEDEEDEP